MAKAYQYDGVTFTLDDSQGCFVEVKYKDQMGHVGVNLRGTKEYPYGYTINDLHAVTLDGLSYGNRPSKGTLQACLDALCRELLRLQREEDSRKTFNKEEACEELHKFVAELKA